MMNGKKLGGEIAVVTGSDSGIEQATAIAFAQEGADVAIAYFRDRDCAERTVEQVQREIARAAAFLASEDAHGVPGTTPGIDAAPMLHQGQGA